ncbi:hypothetical protein AB0L75_38770 [Streptomyces sp. NPDC052101]|uniref:hypothetical protein n=1 Tax=Streptomyces sp. NPDC052101 TaxID=3155763 RepID=UPI00342B6258
MADRHGPAAVTADGIRWRTRATLVLEVAGAFATVGSMAAVIEICRDMLAGRTGTDRLWWLVGAAVAMVLVGFAVQVVGRVLSREAGVRTQERFFAAVTGRVHGNPAARSVHASWRTNAATLGRDIAQTGTMVGRTQAELVSSVTVFALSVGYLFWAAWQMALVTLLPMALGFLVFRVNGARFTRDIRDDYITSLRTVNAVRPRIGLVARLNRAGTRADTAATTRTAAGKLAEVTTGFTEFFLTRVGVLLGARALAEIAFSPLTVFTFVLCGGATMIRSGWLTPADLIPPLVVGVGLGAPLLAITYYLEEIGWGKMSVFRLTAFSSEGQAADPDALTLDLPETGVHTVAEPTDEAADLIVDQVAAATPADRLAVVVPDAPVAVGPVGAYITADRPEPGTPEEAERAARIAGVHETLSALPRGYDSVLGSDASLSSAELQRLALARALAGGRERVLLDQRAFPGAPELARTAAEELREQTSVVLVAPPRSLASREAAQ